MALLKYESRQGADIRHVCWEIEAKIREWGRAGYHGRISPNAFIEVLGYPEKDVLMALFKVAQHGYLNFSLAAVCPEGEVHEIGDFPYNPVGSWAQPAFRPADPSLILPEQNKPIRLHCPACGGDVEVRRDDLHVWFRIPEDYIQYLATESAARHRLRPRAEA